MSVRLRCSSCARISTPRYSNVVVAITLLVSAQAPLDAAFPRPSRVVQFFTGFVNPSPFHPRIATGDARRQPTSRIFVVERYLPLTIVCCAQASKSAGMCFMAAVLL